MMVIRYSAPNEPRPEYRRSLFDRHGPAAAEYLRAGAYGVMVFGLVLAVLGLEVGFGWRWVGVGIIAGIVTAGAALSISGLAGGAWHRIMHSGASTPYEEQFSREQALVMQGRADEALTAYEQAIRASPHAVTPRVRAAELCVVRGQPERAAALLREVQRLPDLPAGSDIFVSNRLVDLLLGPLHDPGRALVELRRIAERYSDTSAADHARTALAKLKRDLQESDAE